MSSVSASGSQYRAERLSRARDSMMSAYGILCIHLMIAVSAGILWLMSWKLDIADSGRWLAIAYSWLSVLAQSFVVVTVFWAAVVLTRLFVAANQLVGCACAGGYVLLSIVLVVGVLVFPKLIAKDITRQLE